FIERPGTGIRSAPRDALIAGSAAPENRGTAFGLECFGDNLGAFIGPLLAILLIFSLHRNLHTIFYLAVIPGLLAVGMILSVREKPNDIPAKTSIARGFRAFPPSFRRYL